jgi:hypothetical protein
MQAFFTTEAQRKKEVTEEKTEMMPGKSGSGLTRGHFILKISVFSVTLCVSVVHKKLTERKKDAIS